MKVYKYLLGFALVAMGMAATSCDTKNEGAIYQSDVANVTFESAEPNQVLTQDASITVPVRIVRANTSGAYTAHYTLEEDENSEGIFTDGGNGTANFADGQAVAVVNITANGMEKGNEYTCTLTLSDADLATADENLDNVNESTTISVMCDYNWLNAGVAQVWDGTWYEEGMDGEVPVEQAEGTNIYRLVAPLYYLYVGEEDNPDESNLQFTYNNDGSITIADGIYMNWWGYMMYYDNTTYPGYCYVAQEGDTYMVNFLLLNGTSLYTGGYFEFTWHP